MVLHDQPVRASSGCYPAFTLPTGSSTGFVSNPGDFGAPQKIEDFLRTPGALFRLGFPAASAVAALASPPRLTPGLILQKARPQAYP